MTKGRFFTYLVLLVFVLSCCRSNNSESDKDSVNNSENAVSEDSSSKEELHWTPLEEVDYKSVKDSVLNLFRSNRGQANYSISKYFYGIRVGRLFDKEHKYALLAYFTSDSSGTVTIYRYKDNQWEMMYIRTGLSMYPFRPLLDFSEIRVEDFNGDNKKDVLVPSVYSGSGKNRAFNLFLYKDSLDTFKVVNGFNDLFRPKFDKATQTIHAIHFGGYGAYIATKYKWQNDQLKKVEKTEHWHKDTVIQKIVHNYQNGANRVNNTDTILIEADSGKKVYLPDFWEEHFRE